VLDASPEEGREALGGWALAEEGLEAEPRLVEVGGDRQEFVIEPLRVIAGGGEEGIAAAPARR